MEDVKIRELPVKSSNLSLTDMLIVEDNNGTSTIAVAEFRSLLQQSLYCNTIEDLKNTVFQENDIVTTLGYRKIGDGGGATYVIAYAPTDIEDNALIHYIHTSDTLRAHFVSNGNTINVKQCGAYGDGINDDYSFITKAIKTGYNVVFPKATYLTSSPVKIPSNVTIDLGGSTVKCKSGACFCFGYNETSTNSRLTNGIITGLKGVELYDGASNINIDNLTIIPIADATKGVDINGSNTVNITNFHIMPSGAIKFQMGIYTANANGKAVYGVSVNNGYINAATGIFTASTIYEHSNVFKNIVFDQCTTGVNIQSKSKNITFDSCTFMQNTTAVYVAGLIDTTLLCSNMSINKCTDAYNISSDSAKVYLSGLQSIIGDTVTTRVFGTLTGTLHSNCTWELENINTTYGSPVGEIEDTTNPIQMKKIVATSIESLNSAMTSGGYWFRNVAIDYQAASSVAVENISAMNGVVIALYSSMNATVAPNGKVDIGSTVTLNKYTPILLKKISGIWTKIS